jgi:hypothetical protein
MSSWDEQKQTCMHGVREGLDSHDCTDCQKVAKEIGLKPSDTGYIFFKMPTKKEKQELRQEYA